MTVTVYADVLFFINFFLDSVCLLLTGRLLSLPCRFGRLLLASFVGGIYAFGVLFLDSFPVVFKFFCHLLASGLLAGIAYGFCPWRKLPKNALLLIACAAALGGFMTAFCALTGRGYRYDGTFYTELPDGFLLLFVPALSLSVFLWTVYCRKKLTTREATLEVTARGVLFRLRVQVDSGCFVREPLSGCAVIPVSASVFSSVYPNPHPDASGLASLGKSARLVGIGTAAGSKLLVCVRPEKLVLCLPGKKPHPLDAYLGLDPDHEDYNGCAGLLPGELLF